jgi:hypothetical protein
MDDEIPMHRVEVRFLDIAPVRRVSRASGVSDVEVDGPILRCVVCGSFQPFLEALFGSEVIELRSSAITHPARGETNPCPQLS